MFSDLFSYLPFLLLWLGALVVWVWTKIDERSRYPKLNESTRNTLKTACLAVVTFGAGLVYGLSTKRRSDPPSQAETIRDTNRTSTLVMNGGSRRKAQKRRDQEQDLKERAEATDDELEDLQSPQDPTVFVDGDRDLLAELGKSGALAPPPMPTGDGDSGMGSQSVGGAVPSMGETDPAHPRDSGAAR